MEHKMRTHKRFRATSRPFLSKRRELFCHRNKKKNRKMYYEMSIKTRGKRGRSHL
ncbi:hypothetical protein BDV41DRAFT_551354 [Aspergillus transmontanensis]|uniref:Uncharacterized protein n=1 Tax=Aspergillus transmontanensis TaxID=1034304 RepID=A0A5N6VJ60_9EURO|nr:hypothetical protein BDV41DRAFT_551354 [Aspergillus transmontanensis]